MNIFSSTTFTWWQVSLLKFAVLFIGLAAGAYFASYVLPYIGVLLVVGLLISLYLLVVWARGK